MKSKEEAIEWAKRVPGSENEIVEVRQIQEMADFTPEIQKAASKLVDLQKRGG